MWYFVLRIYLFSILYPESGLKGDIEITIWAFARLKAILSSASSPF